MAGPVAVLESSIHATRHSLKRSQRALKGWRNLDPGQSRTPLAWPLVSLVATTLWDMKEIPAALCILTMFTTYGRPNEILKLQKQDLVKSTHLGLSWSINLNTSEEMFTSKTGLTDESILLDSPVMPYLGPALDVLAKGSPSAPLFQIDYPHLTFVWKKARSKLGMDPSFAVLYQLRHSGASWDRLKRLRTTLDIKLRGRWSADSSLRRYESHAKVAQLFEKVPLKVRKRAETSPPLLKAMAIGLSSL